jgi:hypothetical protein
VAGTELVTTCETFIAVVVDCARACAVVEPRLATEQRAQAALALRGSLAALAGEQAHSANTNTVLAHESRRTGAADQAGDGAAADAKPVVVTFAFGAVAVVDARFTQAPWAARPGHGHAFTTGEARARNVANHVVRTLAEQRITARGAAYGRAVIGGAVRIGAARVEQLAAAGAARNAIVTVAALHAAALRWARLALAARLRADWPRANVHARPARAVGFAGARFTDFLALIVCNAVAIFVAPVTANLGLR